jgi:hypothetical protein
MPEPVTNSYAYPFPGTDLCPHCQKLVEITCTVYESVYWGKRVRHCDECGGFISSHTYERKKNATREQDDE